MKFSLALCSSLISLAAAAPSPIQKRDSSCFPYGAAFPGNNAVPSVSVDQWWCPTSQQYGFQGFTYPMEDYTCSDYSQSQISADFAQMKRDFGASMVRVYYPACTNTDNFKYLIQAGYDNNMGVIAEIFFGLGDGDPHVQQIADLVEVLQSDDYGPLAPYVFHSVNFGSEPVGDGVDGGPDQFVSDLAAFKTQMNNLGIKVAISEDWDRPGTMSGSNGQGLADIGQKVLDNSDYIHAHVQPFYKAQDETVDETWPYISNEMQWLNSTLDKPIMITETQWAWGDNEHWEGHADTTPAAYTQFWQNYDDNCDLFKSLNIGWFLHAWSGESTFDMLKDDGTYAIPNWKPKTC